MTARSAFIHHCQLKEKQAVIFFLKLLFLLSIIKLIFFLVNRDVLSVHAASFGKMVGWSLLYDSVMLACINLPFLLLCWFAGLLNAKRGLNFISIVFLLLNTFCVLINVADVFYFHFHLQRADADLAFMLSDFLRKSWAAHPFLFIGAMLLVFLIGYVISIWQKRLIVASVNVKYAGSLSVISLSILLMSLSSKKYIPTYPLTNLNSSELIVVQNSMHTFFYSVFRNENAIVRPYQWMSANNMNAIFTNKKMISSTQQKNVVLFIMESVPEDYFDRSSRYKVKMPFLDSLLQHSTYFSNAYSFSHNSNKGIVALLAGLPTLTEIPLYHSSYADLPKSSMGEILRKQGYHNSFLIGDHYDDFGFAKCCNWLGIQPYLSVENIPESDTMEQHTMGLHDEYVLRFMANRLQQTSTPFFSVNYNISTHYPNDLPKNYRQKFPKDNFSDGMKSMQYYSECLAAFFEQVKQQSWFKETVFIFASDHWMYPDARSTVSDITQRFHIPVFVYDPSDDTRKEINSPVSQLDVMNMILHYTKIYSRVISYGEDVLQYTDSNRIVVMRENAALYQAIDKNYVLGFNPINNTLEFVYDYKQDPAKKMNLAGQIDISHQLNYLKAFLQKASWQYHKKSN